MTRAQFLNNLYRRLGGLSREQAEQHLTYYAEMLADRMEEGMTEEEAVASMEDVDTIAQRILQDEGVELPVTPPQAPEPPSRPSSPEVDGTDAFAGSAGPEKPPRKGGLPQWVAPVVAVALCLAVLGGLLGSRGWTHRKGILVNDDGVYIGDFLAVDSDGIRVGNFLYVGPDGIRVGSGAREQITESAPDTATTWFTEDVGVVDEVTVYSYEAYHADGSYVVSALDIQEIEINWVAGAVFIEAWDGEDLQFSENSTVSLDDTTRLYYQVKGGKLSIRYSEKELRSFKGSKQLCLYVPQSLAGSLEELEVDTTSTDVYITRVDAGKLSLDTTSGSFIVEGNYGKVSADTTSGNVDLTGDIREVEFDSTSGSLTVMKNQQLVELDADTVSGDVGLSLPKDTGLTVTFDTVSGLLDSGGFTLTRTGSRYTCGNGACVINVDSVSGNVWLYSE